MRVLIAILGLSLLAAAPGVVSSQQPPTVTIRDFEFGPATLRVALQSGAAQEVRWVNNGPSAHAVSADQGAFRSGPLARGDRFAFTFNGPGTFEYHCEIHPSMKGRIVVERAEDQDGYEY